MFAVFVISCLLRTLTLFRRTPEGTTQYPDLNHGVRYLNFNRVFFPNHDADTLQSDEKEDEGLVFFDQSTVNVNFTPVV